MNQSISSTPVLPTGEHLFSINEDPIIIDDMEFDYEIDNNLLIISDDPSADGFRIELIKLITKKISEQTEDLITLNFSLENKVLKQTNQLQVQVKELIEARDEGVAIEKSKDEVPKFIKFLCS